VSTHELKMSGFSLEFQTNEIRRQFEYMKIDNYVFVDDGGNSAKDLKRTGIDKIIAEIKNNEVDLLVFNQLVA
jgi:hypothetical protein